jgi:phosphomannomutase
MPIKLSTSGIRAPYHELTPDKIVRFAQAFATFTAGGDIALCSDLRPSHGFLREAVAAGLLACGADVLDYGNLPTPIVQWIIRQHHFHGGVSISGGHNPFDWNALIFLNRDGSYLNQSEGEEFFNLYHSGQFARKGSASQGQWQASSRFLDDYFSQLRLPTGAETRGRFVIDCAYGFRRPLVDRLSRALGITLIPLFCGEEDMLAKDPEPNSRNAGFLATVVRETGSDGGFQINSDASRILIVDEKGQPFSEELTLPIFARILLEEERCDIVTNYSTSKAVDRVAKSFGVHVFRTDVGQPHVIQAVRELRTKIGGEGSGSVVHTPFSLGFDSFLFMKRLIEFLRCQHQPLSALHDEFADPEIVKETIFLPEYRIYRSLEKIERLFNNPLRLKDGFYVEDGSCWLCIRASSTVAMIRIQGEGAGIAAEINRLKELI